MGAGRQVHHGLTTPPQVYEASLERAEAIENVHESLRALLLFAHLAYPAVVRAALNDMRCSAKRIFADAMHAEVVPAGCATGLVASGRCVRTASHGPARACTRSHGSAQKNMAGDKDLQQS